MISGLLKFLVLEVQVNIISSSICQQDGKIKVTKLKFPHPQHLKLTINMQFVAESKILSRATFWKDHWFSNHLLKEIPTVWKLLINNTFMEAQT